MFLKPQKDYGKMIFQKKNQFRFQTSSVSRAVPRNTEVALCQKTAKAGLFGLSSLYICQHKIVSAQWRTRPHVSWK